MKKTILSMAVITAMSLNIATPLMSLDVHAAGETSFNCGDYDSREYELNYAAGDKVVKTLNSTVASIYVGNGADVTIDMNGFTISDNYGDYYEVEPSNIGDTELDIVELYVPSYRSICVAEGRKLTLRGEGYVEEDIVNGGYLHIDGRIVARDPLLNYGEAVIDDIIMEDYEVDNGYDEAPDLVAKLTINGGQFRSSHSLDLDINNYGRSELVINGGVFGADDVDTMIYNDGVTTVTGGKFISQSGEPIIMNHNDNINGDEAKPAAYTDSLKPELYVSGGEFESIYVESEAGLLSIIPNSKPQLDYEPIGECVDANGYSTDNANCITQISGGYYRYFIPNSDFFVEGYKDFEVDADTVQVRGSAPEPEAKPEEPKEEVKNPDTFDGLTGLISALSISFISGFGLVNFLKHRR